MQKKFKHKRISPFKLITIAASIIVMVMVVNYFINKSYNNYLNKFYSVFNSCDFDSAKELFNTDNLITHLKSKAAAADLKEYFTSIVSIISSEIKAGSISTDNALKILKEIDTYQLLNSSLEKMILALEPSYSPSSPYSYKSILQIADDYCKSGDYSKALELLNKIPDDNSAYYSSAEEIMNKCKDSYKNELFAEADELIANDYYTKAINLLSNADTSILGENDAEILSKINKIEQLKDNYLASVDDESADTASVMSENISINNINTSNINSNTSYLIYVNEAQQIVYIYSGSCNNWDLIDNYECSTGIASEPTPTGIFTVTDRGEWFYADQYGQGGKYWVQFLGDYLFHSLPYNETQDEIVDDTLGVPASHGCIRLATEDAKWIYDNIPNDTTVIIN